MTEKENVVRYWLIFGGGPYRRQPGGLRWTGKEDTKGFFDLRFYDGKLIEDWPQGITFWYKGERQDDYILVPGLWYVVSDKVKRVFEKCEVKGVQFLPIDIVHIETGEKQGLYWAMNVYQEVDALNWERTIWMTPEMNHKEDEYPTLDIIEPALRLDVVKGLDIFRLNVKEIGDVRVFISERLKQAIDEAKANSGFKFNPIPAFEG
jgi:hypothetical protein